MRYRLSLSTSPRLAELTISAAASSDAGSTWPPSSSTAGRSTADDELAGQRWLCRSRMLAPDEYIAAGRLHAMRRRRYSYGTGCTSTFHNQHSPSSTSSSSAGSSETRQLQQSFASYRSLLHRLIETGTGCPYALLYHHDAPSPAEAVLEVMTHMVPSHRFLRVALEACAEEYRGGEGRRSQHSSTQALRRLGRLLLSTPGYLASRPELHSLLVIALLKAKLFHEVEQVLLFLLNCSGSTTTTSPWLSPDAWALTVEAASQGKLPHSELLDELFRVTPVRGFSKVPTGPCEFRYLLEHSTEARKTHQEALSLCAPLHALLDWSSTADTAIRLGLRGVTYGLTSTTTTQLLLRAGTSFSNAAPPRLAASIIRVYMESCRLLQEELSSVVAAGSMYVSADTTSLVPAGEAATLRMALAVHPTPIFVLIRLLKDARSPGGPHSIPVALAHWRQAWGALQMLNKANPWWLQRAYHSVNAIVLGEESSSSFHSDAEGAVRDVLEVLCRGASPWMSLNVARLCAGKHLMDGLDAALWLLHRLDPAHHTVESRQVAGHVFRWLLADVGIHLHEALHHHLVPLARVLIRLEMTSELQQLYQTVLNRSYAFSPVHKSELLRVMSDFICPVCSSLVMGDEEKGAAHAEAEKAPTGATKGSMPNVYKERVCQNCLVLIPAKERDAAPSFSLTEEHLGRIRERRRAKAEQARQRFLATSSRRLSAYAPVDDLKRLRRLLLSSQEGEEAAEQRRDSGDAFIPGVTLSSSASLHPSDPSRPLLSEVSQAKDEASRRLSAHQLSSSTSLMLAGRARLQIPTRSLNTMDLPPAMEGQQAITLLGSSWVCVWCRELHSEYASRLVCRACGAETGPEAPWRVFRFASDAMSEVRQRMLLAADRLEDAVSAAYALMLFRQTFLLRSAPPKDTDLLMGVLRTLAAHHERVLLGYLVVRLVSPQDRCIPAYRPLLIQIAEEFHEAERKRSRQDGSNGETEEEEGLVATPAAAVETLTEAEVADDEVLFPIIFTPHTCRLCFGRHPVDLCPIRTRRFPPPLPSCTPLRATTEERTAAGVSHLQRRVQVAQDAVNAASAASPSDGARSPIDPKVAAVVAAAYTAFLASGMRELFARLCSLEANQLSILLSRLGQYRRAAFVLCHIPLPQRQSQAYMMLLKYYQVDSEAAVKQLNSSTRSGSRSYPTIMQVTKVCCMCLEEPHASHLCPRLQSWADAVTKTKGSSSASDNAAQEDARLRAQASGWTSSGPERLHTFYRFLLQRMITMRTASPPQEEASDTLIWALNQTITGLLTASTASDGGDPSGVTGARTLVAHTPPRLLLQETVAMMLRVCEGYDPDVAQSMVEDPDDGGLSAISAAVPLKKFCLLCFQSSGGGMTEGDAFLAQDHDGDEVGADGREAMHTFLRCSDLIGTSSLSHQVRMLCEHVGSLTISAPAGPQSAAAALTLLYQEGKLRPSLFRHDPSLALCVLSLAHRCFACGERSAAVRLMRHLPLEMVPLEMFPLLWRSAGLAEAAVEERLVAVQSLYDAEGLEPSHTNPPPRRSFSASFSPHWHGILFDGLCRHCFSSNHTLECCELLREEVCFGRDLVAAYRMCVVSEGLESAWQDAYLLALTRFIQAHRMWLPYHVTGVANALNAITVMWGLRGFPGIAATLLLAVPPAFRRAQTVRHVLHAFHIPPSDAARVVSKLQFSREVTPPSSSSPQRHPLLVTRTALRDELKSTAFTPFPAARRGLAEADAAMKRIEERCTLPLHSLDVAQQVGGVAQLREDFDPLLSLLEEMIGIQLGSRHVLFTNTVAVLSEEKEGTRR